MMESPLDLARDLIRRGWNPLPLPYRGKKPLDREWQHRIIDEAKAPQFFNGKQMNVGVVLGQSSKGLTDIDLDCAEAIELAPYLLPPTDAIFGRSSSPASHWLYTTSLSETESSAVIPFKDPSGAMIVELRIGGSKGAQTVAPGSTHETGERIEWTKGKGGDPARFDGLKLRHCVAALASGVLLVRGWPVEGGRHDAARVLGGFLARLGWSTAQVKHYVGAIASVANDNEREDRQRAAEDSANAHSNGLHSYGFPALSKTFGAEVARSVADWLGYKASPGASAEVIDQVLDIEPVVTQDGLARVFAARYADHLRYCHHTGAWFEWKGSRWQQNCTEVAFQFARELGRQHTEGAKVSELKEVRKVAFAAGVERFARSDPIFAVTSEHWDRDPWLLGTPGGTVDLRMGQLREADPRDGITKLTAVTPSDRIECPRWLAFLEEATGGDAALIRFLRQWCGYSLTGITREHALIFVHGGGGNGKTVFLNTVSGIVLDYATVAAMDTFTSSKSDKHPTDLAMLRGARLVTASETEEGRVWAEARIKQMTGGDPITARFMRQDFFTFRPQFKLTIVGNHQPVLRNVDDAARRRFNIVPFTRKPARPDPELEQKLRSEWPGILRWMIEGCLDWQTNGLMRPQSVTEATADYFAEQDLFNQWLDEKCDVERDNSAKWATTSELFSSWSAYAKAAGEDPGTTRAFAPNMRRKGIRPYRHMKARGWSGIRLRLEPRYGEGHDA
jgi:P4 family phage/plasmid primase-like protien